MFSFLLILNEAQQGVDVRHQLIVRPQNLAGMVQADFRPIEQPMGFGQAVNRLGGKLISLERHDVDAPRPGRIAVAEHIRRNIVQHAAETGRERIAAERRVVMNGHAAGERRMIVNSYMAAQQRARWR